jgi:hypothetical protein
MTLPCAVQPLQGKATTMNRKTFFRRRPAAYIETAERKWPELNR